MFYVASPACDLTKITVIEIKKSQNEPGMKNLLRKLIHGMYGSMGGTNSNSTLSLPLLRVS